MSLPDFIKPVKEVTDNQGAYVLIYGSPGVGKTSISATMPSPERVLVVSVENGTMSIQDSGVHVAQVHTLNDVKRVYAYLKGNPDAYNVVILDSITEIGELTLSHELKKSKDPRKAYGELAVTMVDLLKSFRDLPQMDVICIANLKAIEDDGTIMRTPSMPGKQLLEKIPYLFDIVGEMVAQPDESGEIKRAICFEPSLRRIAKDRSGKLDRWEKPNLDALLKKIRGESAEEGGDDEAL